MGSAVAEQSRQWLWRSLVLSPVRDVGGTTQDQDGGYGSAGPGLGLALQKMC